MRCSSRVSTRTRHRSARRTCSSTQREACALRRMPTRRASRRFGRLVSCFGRASPNRRSLCRCGSSSRRRLRRRPSMPPSRSFRTRSSISNVRTGRGLIRAVYERAQGYQPVPDVVNQDRAATRGRKAGTPGQTSASAHPESALSLHAAAAGMAIVLWLVVSQLSTRPQACTGADQPGRRRRCADRDRFFSGRAGRSREPFHSELVTQAPNPAPDSPKTIDESPRRGSASAGGRARRSSPRAVQPAADVVTLQAADVSSATRCRRAMRPTR